MPVTPIVTNSFAGLLKNSADIDANACLVLLTLIHVVPFKSISFSKITAHAPFKTASFANS